MLQEELFHEDFRDALRHVVSALGGPKRVGCELQPAFTADRARCWLSHCLDESRPEKFDIEHVVQILRMARQKGLHSAFAFLAGELGYEEPRPVEPEDEQAKLQREYIEAVKHQAELIKRLEKVQNATMLRAVKNP